LYLIAVGLWARRRKVRHRNAETSIGGAS
jgi:hypothetical protein